MTHRVTYQGLLERRTDTAGTYVRLDAGAIGTKRKRARVPVTVELSKEQARWLAEVSEVSGAGIDDGSVLRALVDLGMELDVDWPLLAKGAMLRDAVRASVMVRRPTGD